MRSPGDRRAVFIDKDGTLVVDVPFNVDPRRLQFTRNAMPALRLLDQAGYALIVITNQPGLAIGHFTLAEFAALRRTLVGRIREQTGVELAGFYTCPHSPDIAGSPTCSCRKPMPGLLRAAALAHCLDLEHCWMVGDILNDVEAGRRAGCRTILLDVGNETEWHVTPLRTPDRRCADLLEAAQHIVGSESGQFHPHPMTGMAETR
jgi:histidinol-phosphate phosphatase family protein